MTRCLSLAISLLTLCLFAAPSTAAAFDPFGGLCGDAGASTSAVCRSQQTAGPNSDPLINILTDITNIVAFVAGAAAIIIVIVSALRFITAGSDTSTGSRTDTDVEDAKRSIASALVGLVIVVLARTIILFVLKGF